MKLIDMHCDTIGKIMDLDKKGNLGENFCSVTISEMKRAKSLAQFFACFTYLGDYIDNGGYDACYVHALDIHHTYADDKLSLLPLIFSVYGFR